LRVFFAGKAWELFLDNSEGRGKRHMTEIAELTTRDTLKLPEDVAARFRPSDRFIVWAEGDTLYLKRIAPKSVTSIVAEAPEGVPMSLEEINDLVHQVRKKRRAE
jgi:hypothetical protein